MFNTKEERRIFNSREQLITDAITKETKLENLAHFASPIIIRKMVEPTKQELEDAITYGDGNVYGIDLVVGQTIFGIEDKLQPIDKYIKEIKESDLYNYFVENVSNKVINKYLPTDKVFHNFMDKAKTLEDFQKLVNEDKSFNLKKEVELALKYKGKNTIDYLENKLEELGNKYGESSDPMDRMDTNINNEDWFYTIIKPLEMKLIDLMTPIDDKVFEEIKNIIAIKDDKYLVNLEYTHPNGDIFQEVSTITKEKLLSLIDLEDINFLTRGLNKNEQFEIKKRLTIDNFLSIPLNQKDFYNSLDFINKKFVSQYKISLDIMHEQLNLIKNDLKNIENEKKLYRLKLENELYNNIEINRRIHLSYTGEIGKEYKIKNKLEKFIQKLQKAEYQYQALENRIDINKLNKTINNIDTEYKSLEIAKLLGIKGVKNSVYLQFIFEAYNNDIKPLILLKTVDIINVLKQLNNEKIMNEVRNELKEEMDEIIKLNNNNNFKYQKEAHKLNNKFKEKVKKKFKKEIFKLINDTIITKEMEKPIKLDIRGFNSYNKIDDNDINNNNEFNKIIFKLLKKYNLELDILGISGDNNQYNITIAGENKNKTWELIYDSKENKPYEVSEIFEKKVDDGLIGRKNIKTYKTLKPALKNLLENSFPNHFKELKKVVKEKLR